jgi:hypothetical protein
VGACRVEGEYEKSPGGLSHGDFSLINISSCSSILPSILLIHWTTPYRVFIDQCMILGIGGLSPPCSIKYSRGDAKSQECDVDHLTNEDFILYL